MAFSRSVVAAAVEEDRVMYGVTTGFGALADTHVGRADLERMQLALVRSHSAGVGAPLPDEVVRGMLLLRARTLAAGYSGVRVDLPRRLLELLDRGSDHRSAERHPVLDARAEDCAGLTPRDGDQVLEGDGVPRDDHGGQCRGGGGCCHGGQLSPSPDPVRERFLFGRPSDDGLWSTRTTRWPSAASDVARTWLSW